MSLDAHSYGNRIRVTLDTPLSGGERNGITCWVKFAAAGSVPNGQGHGVCMVGEDAASEASGNSYLGLMADDGRKPLAACRAGTDGATAAGTGVNLTDNVWAFMGMSWGPYDGGSQDLVVLGYDNALDSYDTASPTANDAAAALAYVVIGGRLQFANEWGFTEGKIAEVALWKGISKADFLTMCAEQYSDGKRPDAVAVATPHLHQQLFDDSSINVGSGTVTEEGTVVFTSGDHPTLSAPSAGGSPKRRRVIVV